ncbi:MAG: hypothetical protein IPN18_07135 [Ignavibacteriales bacterium]|nr:hypothetical protein [Ignavibacteriales bacterium]
MNLELIILGGGLMETERKLHNSPKLAKYFYKYSISGAAKCVSLVGTNLRDGGNIWSSNHTLTEELLNIKV